MKPMSYLEEFIQKHKNVSFAAVALREDSFDNDQRPFDPTLETSLEEIVRDYNRLESRAVLSEQEAEMARLRLRYSERDVERLKAVIDRLI